MKVAVNGKEYAFEMRGTVGLVYMAERLLPDGEAFDPAKGYHNCLLFYAIVASSNTKYPDLQDFLVSLTAAKYRELNEYVSRRWAELDPPATEADEDESGADKKKD